MNETYKIGEPSGWLHCADFGKLLFVKMVNVGPGDMPLYRCELCDEEIDGTETDRICGKVEKVDA
jgi:hypothetical protein